MRILSARQMAEVDRLTTEVYRIPSMLLMENAGRAVFGQVAREHPDLRDRRILVFCGKGNNGGDGMVCARYMAEAGGHAEILLFADPTQLRGDAGSNWAIVDSLGIPRRTITSASAWRAAARTLEPPDIIIDALFGTGLSKPIANYFRGPVEWINRLSGKSWIVSVDLPSGLFADSPEVPGPVVRADLTVTFTSPKLAHILPPASDSCGRLAIEAIGSPAVLLQNPEYRVELIDSDVVRRTVPARARDGHKGDYGHIFVLAGSRGKSGAALLTGMAALRTGAGLVTLLVPDVLQKDLIGKVPELMTESLSQTPHGAADFAALDRVLALSSHGHALVIGPGMTTASSTRRLIREVVRLSTVPVILDADGVNAFARESANLRNDAGSPVVVTPHPGEMARLLGTTITSVQRNRVATTRATAQESGIFVVLKGHQTLISTPDGRLLINSTGNPGMATGGSGDVLSGMIGRFVGFWNRKYRGKDLRSLADHVAAAVHLHGMAGDLAAGQTGMESLIATDLIARIPEAFRKASVP